MNPGTTDWPVPPPPLDNPDPGDITVPGEQTGPGTSTDAPLGRDSNIFSPAFQFVEWTSYVFESKSGEAPRFTPDIKYKTNEYEGPFQSVKNKWVYLFQDLKGEFTWYGEYFITDSGEIQSVDLSLSQERERDDRPAPRPGHDRACLAHKVNGRSAFYYGYASRIRLPYESIAYLLANRNGMRLLTGVDTNARAYKGENGPNRLYEQKDKWYFCVTDPMTVALTLGADYLTARSEALAYCSIYKGQPPGQSARVRERHAMKMVAEVLVSFLPNGADPRGIADLLTGNSGAAMEKFLKDYANTQRRNALETDLRAIALCSWLRGECFGIAETAHFFEPEKDASAFLNVYAQATMRLVESSPGMAFWGDLLADKSHLVHKYVMPSGPMAPTAFAISKSAASAVITVWEQLSARYMHLYGVKSAGYIANSLEYVSGVRLLEVTHRAGWVKSAMSDGGAYRQAAEATELTVLSPNAPAFAKWIQCEPSTKAVYQKIMYGAEIINFGLAIKTVYDTGWKDMTVPGMLSAIGSSADLFAATGSILKKLGERPLAVFGGVSAAIGFVCAVNDLASAADRHDYTSVAGFGMAGLAAALTAAASYCAWTGAMAATTGIGISGTAVMGVLAAVLGVTSAVVIAIGGHSDFQVFVNHCSFGKFFGHGGATSWSAEVAMATWKQKPELQIPALLGLVTAFSLEEGGPLGFGVKIVPGMVRQNSRFHVFYTNTYHGNNTPLNSEVYVQMDARKLVHAGGEKADISKCTVAIDWPAAEPFVFIRGALHPQVSRGSIKTSKCTVCLDLDGEGEQFYPADKSNWPEIEIKGEY